LGIGDWGLVDRYLDFYSLITLYSPLTTNH
jgi:hypothetical protein